MFRFQQIIEVQSVKRRIATSLLVLAAGAGNASELPFAATRNVPDYTASMIVRNMSGEPKEMLRSVVHHKGWTRVESVNGNHTAISYGNYFDNTVLRTTRTGNEDFAWMSIEKTDRSLDLSVKQAKETGETDNQAGEACKWWQLIRTKEEMAPLWFSCLSADGIEVSQKVLFRVGKPMSDTQLVRLDRTAVAESEISPPKKLFDPWFWLKPLRDYPEPEALVDFEARMVGGWSEVRILRHYPWRSEERREKGGTLKLTIWNELENQGISIISSKDMHDLHAGRAPLDPKRPYNTFQLKTGQVDLKRTGGALGETCAWFNMTPNLADAGRQECLTPDGVPLEINILSGWGHGESYTAVEIKRRPVELKEMIPPSELTDPSSWGFTVSD
ncbi:hypothetical protein [Rhizobium sp. WYCCWR10014]|uniref:hypothetical protein n=1 Tax=Rhizobium sp. WYCCWR10014 TaxID=1825933 RepID=UPI000AF760F7|nr:hypothetical protein [Rhizobium sp. WYCCWR10014]